MISRSKSQPARAVLRQGPPTSACRWLRVNRIIEQPRSRRHTHQWFTAIQPQSGDQPSTDPAIQPSSGQQQRNENTPCSSPTKKSPWNVWSLQMIVATAYNANMQLINKYIGSVALCGSSSFNPDWSWVASASWLWLEAWSLKRTQGDSEQRDGGKIGGWAEGFSISGAAESGI